MSRNISGISLMRAPLQTVFSAGSWPVLIILAASTVSAEPAGEDHRDTPCDSHHRSASEVVQDFYTKLGQGDLAGMVADFSEDATWVLYGPAEIPFAGVHQGRSGIQSFIETFGQNAAVSVFEPKEFLAGRHKVVVQGYEEATATPTGKTWEAHWTHSFTVQKGEIVLVEEVLETAPVLAAFQP